MRPFIRQCTVLACFVIVAVSSRAETLEELEKRYNELKHGKAPEGPRRFYVEQRGDSGKVLRTGPFSYKTGTLVKFLGTSYAIVQIDGNSFYLKRIGQAEKLGPCAMRDGATLLADSLAIRTSEALARERSAASALAVEKAVNTVHSRRRTIREDIGLLEKVLAENPEAPNRPEAERLLAKRKEEMDPGFAAVATTRTSGGRFKSSFMRECPACSGTGLTPGIRKPTKAGPLTTGGWHIPKCKTCNGGGKIETAQCPTCSGRGSVERGTVMKGGRPAPDIVSCPQCDGLTRKKEEERARKRKAELAQNRDEAAEPQSDTADDKSELVKLADSLARSLMDAGRIHSAERTGVQHRHISRRGRTIRMAQVDYRFEVRSEEGDLKDTKGYLSFRYDPAEKKWTNSETHIE